MARYTLVLLLAAVLALAVLRWGRGAAEAYENTDARDDARDDDDDEAWLETRLRELHAHLAQVDPELEDLVGVVKDVKILEDNAARRLPNGKIGFNSGKFKHSTGVLWVGSRDGHGRQRSRGTMLMTLLHEMAHATVGPTHRERGTPHDTRWGDVWKRLLRHATQHLGWEVEVRCAECTYYDLCAKEQCPKCVWTQAQCAPYQGGSPSDFKRTQA
jgi:hypothetical protein